MCQELARTVDYGDKHEMKINHKKTKAMLFNPCTSVDFMPDIKLGSHQLEVVEEIKLLGITVRSDMKWHSNTQAIVQKANKRLWILRRLKHMGATDLDMVDMYIKQIRSILELAVPVWQGALTLDETRPSTGLGSCDNNDLEDHFLSKLPTHLKNSYPAALNKEPLFI